MNNSEVKLVEEEEEIDTSVTVGDMFEWVTDNKGSQFIYLGSICPRIPLVPYERTLNGWNSIGAAGIAGWLKDGSIKRMPSGTQLIITQR